ncbi:MAG: glycosyltransferase [Pyrinomonadaceae bacterium]|nr:glycosyltransferase [Phycisphaerales bacterium]
MQMPADHPPSNQPRLRIALAHDWLCGYRGGEAVLDRIARLLIEHHACAGLWVMVDDGRPVSSAIDSIPRTTSFLQQLPGGATTLRRWLLPLYPAAVGSLSRSLLRAHRKQPIDLLISTSSSAIKGLRAPAGVPHLCYCHSPARYIWSVRDEYCAGGTGPRGLAGLPAKLRNLGLALTSSSLQRWDDRTASHVDCFLANSTHTQQEIKRCYGRDSHVVFPPVRTGYFVPREDPHRDSFWLVAGALEPYKRVDLAIAAANAKGHELRIAGDGSSRESLKAQAGPSIKFLGRVDDATLRQLFQTAGALLFPQVEDFGIVAVEAQACGLPVIARARGGALDTVIPGVTGAFFERPTADGLLQAVARAPSGAADACRKNAERFSEHEFDAAIHRAIAKVLNPGR